MVLRFVFFDYSTITFGARHGLTVSTNSPLVDFSLRRGESSHVVSTSLVHGENQAYNGRYVHIER